MTKITGLKGNVNLGGKMKLPTSKAITTDKIDKIARTIDKVSVEDQKEKNTRITLDIPQSIYKKMKFKTFEESMTLRSYVLDLINKDLAI